ncbi:hypothetical protein PP707_05995 [Acetobacter pasteurianus]|nr:hypothetical protein [Acetobacter pasteurianus]
MNDINSDTHSWMHSLDSFESFACDGNAAFITRPTFLKKDVSVYLRSFNDLSFLSFHFVLIQF